MDYGYVRDLLLLDISLFAAFSSQTAVTEVHPMRKKALDCLKCKEINANENKQNIRQHIYHTLYKYVNNHFWIKGKRKTYLHLWSLVLNLLYTLFYFANPIFTLVYSSFSDISKISSLFLNDNIIPLTICTFLSLLLIYFFAVKCDVERINVDRLNKKYLDFTAKGIDNNSEMFLFAGNLTFLNEVPVFKKKLTDADWENCKMYIQQNSCKNNGKCPLRNSTCILKSDQYNQLVNLSDKNKQAITLKLMIRKPENNEKGRSLKALLGKLCEVFSDGDAIEIRYYSEDTHNRIWILSRIKMRDDKSVMLCHWNNEDSTYSTPQEYGENENMGKTFIFFFKKLWDDGVSAKNDYDDFKKAYNDAVTIE